MKKSAFVLSALLLAGGAIHAQQVKVDTFDSLVVRYATPEVSVATVPFADGKAEVLEMEGYLLGGEVGSPALPMLSSQVTVPFCQSFKVEVRNAIYDTIDALLSSKAVMPLQPSRSKSDTSHRAPVVNNDRYATSELWGLPLARMEYQGIARDRRLANLVFSPVQVNPVTGQVVVCRYADVVVRYVGADREATIEHFQRYYTPAFSAGKSINDLFSAKEIRTSAPVRMVIVSNSTLRCDALQRFADWKRTQGMMVDVVYYNEQGIASNTAIANYIKAMYTNATEESPAPTYLVLVGDKAQMPSFNSKLPSASYYPDNDHVTDLYYATWTSGDNIPDCYQGRLSVTSVSMLTSVIDKILLYEKYAFADDSYLSRAALVSGEDNGSHRTTGWSADQAWIYCDPSMDYVAYNYINAANGFTNVTYYKNDISYAPTGVTVTGYCSDANASDELLNLYDTGIGWINYTAHGDTNKWHQPEFTNSDVNGMSNNGKPSFMIGNCCLTNHFNSSTCFGEALLRKGNNAGAVAYIGGTNSTYWEEDVYWSVGFRSNITHNLSPDYNASNTGIYDHLFHTHGEALGNQIATAGAIVMYGDMSVNNNTSSSDNMKKYYWEIYELMGDPSLMPWLGTASTLDFDYAYTDGCIHVATAPNAYVAIVDSVSLELKASGFVGADGTLDFCIDTTGFSTAIFSATSQGHRPFFTPFKSITVGVQDTPAPELTLAPNPATAECRVTAEGLRQVDLLDMTGRILSSQKTSQSDATLDLRQMPQGIYLVRVLTSGGVAVRKLVVNK